jgi:hypothetical protein
LGGRVLASLGLSLQALDALRGIGQMRSSLIFSMG